MRILLLMIIGGLWQINTPRPADPLALAAKDQHQGFLVAASPCSDAKASKEKLGNVDAFKAGLLPVEVYFRNDTKEPVHVDLSTIRLDIDTPNGQRLHLVSLSLEQTASEIAHPKGASAPSARRFPPILGVPIRDSKQRDVLNKLQPLVFQTDVVAPGATVHGFVFFDLNHDYDLVSFASLYVPDVKSVASSEAMIYFEVPFKNASAH